MTESYSGRAKLLLTGEYLVLYGARALAVPLIYNQTLHVKIVPGENTLEWKAYEKNLLWFNAEFKIPEIETVRSSDFEISSRLANILKMAQCLNSGFLNNEKSYSIDTHIDFGRQWGLGTSSTLIFTIAQWANINPYDLHWKVSGGSGYDIACANASGPLMYSVNNQIPVIQSVALPDILTRNAYFVYLGNKQNSTLSISPFLDKKDQFTSEIKAISEITDQLLRITSISGAYSLIREHEKIVAAVLDIKPLQDRLFSNFPGAIKSLGAWGGDFIMALSDAPPNVIYDFFSSRNFQPIFRWNEMVFYS
jgi:mevalonate kinase